MTTPSKTEAKQENPPASPAASTDPAPSSEDARRVIQDVITPTPVASSDTLNRAWNCRVFFKLEMLTTTGSFKERGALYKLNSLSSEERERGVVAASAGNHAQALAFHAARMNIPCTIVMPEAAPLIKVRNTTAHGANVILHGNDYDEARAHAYELSESDGQVYVSGFDDPWIIAGQGTIALELLEQVPDFDCVVVPVGGGGLIAGIASVIKKHRPQTRIIGVQASQVPSARAAIQAGHPVEIPAGSTIADGIAVRKVGKLCFDAIEKHVDQIVEVDEPEIAQAVLLMLEQEKAVVEGAGAVGVAALMSGKISGIEGNTVVIILSGGNIDVNRLSRIIDKGLVNDGRLARLRVDVPDRPGELARILAAVAELRANIIEVQHHRAFAEGPVGSTAIELTIETRGRDHLNEILKSLQSQHVELEKLA
jgi:threonine dehydratase